MFYFIAVMAFNLAIITIGDSSQSYREEMFFGVFLIPIWILRIIYTRYENKKMGSLVFKLRKTFSEEHSLLVNAVFVILGAAFIALLTFGLSGGHEIGNPWLILLVMIGLERVFNDRFLQKGLMEKGICTGSQLIPWDKVRAYKWVGLRKKRNFRSLKITYARFYSTQIAYLTVLDDQKDEVRDFLEGRRKI